MPARTVLSLSAAELHSPGPRLAALLETRRWLLLLLLTVAWTYPAGFGFAHFADITPADRILLLVSVPFMIGAWLLSRRRYGLWLLLGGPGCLVLAAALNGGQAESTAWIYLSVSAGHLTFVFVVQARRWIGLASIVATAALLALVWAPHPTNVAAGPLAVANGWIAVAALAANGLGAWFAWHRLLSEARAADSIYLALANRTSAELSTQEQSRAWRAAAVAVHERLLSTLRYVLQSDELDRDGLREFNSALPTADLLAGDADRSLESATAARIASNIVRVEPSAILLPMADGARAAARAALVESAINAVQHGGATEVVVTGAVTQDWVAIHIKDNGVGISADATPGIGWTSVLDHGLAAVGGNWSARREAGHTVVTLNLPRVDSAVSSDDPTRPDSDPGRLLISATLISFAIVGLAYNWILGTGTQGGWLLIADSFLATAAGLWVVVRGRSIRPRTAIGFLLPLAAIPWIIWWVRPDVGQLAAIGGAFGAAGYGIIAVATWSRWYMWVFGLGFWAWGALVTSAAYDGVSLFPIAAALVNSLITLPVVASVSTIGTRRFLRAQAALEVERETIRRESLRATASVVINQHLASCVNAAEKEIANLAAGAELNAATRHKLNCLDGLIRATIQVDPAHSGTFSRVASQLVALAFGRSIPADVGTIIASEDSRRLPAELRQHLDRLVSAANAFSIRAFSSNDRDYLSVTLRPGTSQLQSALSTLPAASGDDCTIEVDPADDDSVMLLLSRPVAK